jgi:hypothetical protein
VDALGVLKPASIVSEPAAPTRTCFGKEALSLAGSASTYQISPLFRPALSASTAANSCSVVAEVGAVEVFQAASLMNLLPELKVM